MKHLFCFVIFEIICCTLKTYIMRDDSDFPHANCLRVLLFQQKSWSLLNSPNINENLLFEVIIVFCYFYTFSHMCIVCWGLIHWKVFLPLLPFTKKLGRSTYDVTMTHYEVIVILFLFRFVANAHGLQLDNFLVLTINRRGVIRI